MKMRLFYKIMLSFMFIIILGGVIIAFTINVSTSKSFTAMVRESDIAYAQELSILLSEYYIQTKTWDGVAQLIRLPSQMGMMGNNMNRKSRIQGQDSGNDLSDHINARGQFRALSVIVLSPGGNIIFTNIDDTGLILPDNSGIPVFGLNNLLIAKVFAGSMIGSDLMPVQTAFLDSVQRAIILASIAVIISTFIIGFFLVKHITSPVTSLYDASNSIAKGDFKVRVDVNRHDELGDLATGFNLMAESLEAAELWKQQIIADSAHELRTPVSLIQGHLEMMLEGVYPIDRKGIQNIYDETLLLTSLISELQELSSTEAGLGTFEMEKVSLGDLILSVKNNFKPKMDENKITLNINIEKGLSKVIADRQKLNQVLMNVLTNSIKFTPPEGNITISAWPNENRNLVYVSVEDTGTGIDPEERTKIFNRFYRIDKHRNRKTGGSGLGLAISSEIIARHGGSIKAVDPISGKGSRILISLNSEQ
jgi:two-component system, OmpR family, sensor histidine kinase BaeS